jgi:hypothetical protein
MSRGRNHAEQRAERRKWVRAVEAHGIPNSRHLLFSRLKAEKSCRLLL